MKWLKNFLAPFSIADRWILGAAFILCALFFSYESQAGERWIVVGDGTWLTVSGSPVIQDPSLSWPALLQAKSRHQILAVNNDNTGFMFNASNLMVQIEAVKVLKPTGIIIAAGVVDWMTNQDLTTTLTRISLTVAAARAANVPVVCLTPHYRTDWQTRRMPLSARGRPLFTVPSNPGVAGFANILGSYCSLSGAHVIWGHHVAFGFGFVGPLTSFTRTALLPVGHEAMATHVYQQLVNKGLMQVVP